MIPRTAQGPRAADRMTRSPARILARALYRLMAAVVDRRTIPFLHWQHRLPVPVSGSALGEIVHGYDDLEQAIDTIVRTQKRTVPLEPEACCDLLPYIDRAPPVAVPNLAREIWDGLRAWEPRIVVVEVKPRPVSDSQWRFPVSWYARADIDRQIRQTEIAYAAP